MNPTEAKGAHKTREMNLTPIFAIVWEELLGIRGGRKTFPVGQTEIAARIWLDSRWPGAPIGDRARLALSRGKLLPVLTVDRSYQKARLDLDRQLIG